MTPNQPQRVKMTDPSRYAGKTILLGVTGSIAAYKAVSLARRLRALKMPFEQIVIPGEGHDFLLHRTWVEVFTATAEFFDRNLKTKTKSEAQK